jgi:hypothetical protein
MNEMIRTLPGRAKQLDEQLVKVVGHDQVRMHHRGDRLRDEPLTSAG